MSNSANKNSIAAILLGLKTIAVSFTQLESKPVNTKDAYRYPTPPEPVTKTYTYLVTSEQYTAIEEGAVVVLPSTNNNDFPTLGIVVRKDRIPQIDRESGIIYKPIIGVVDSTEFNKIKNSLNGIVDDLLEFDAGKIREAAIQETFGSIEKYDQFQEFRKLRSAEVGVDANEADVVIKVGNDVY